jgi:hypothetical protein
MVTMSYRGPWDAVPTCWKAIRYRVHTGLKSYGADNEAIRSDYFAAIRAEGWKDGSPLPLIHYAIKPRGGSGPGSKGLIAHPKDRVDPFHAAHMKGIAKATRGKKL